MQGVLIIAHGSRREETTKTMEHIVKLTKEKLEGVEVVASYMEFNEPNVHDGLEELKSKGVDKISVVPYFLFEGIHIKEDIPEELEAFSKANPDIEVIMGETLGKDPRLADVLADRVKDAIK